MNSTCWTTVSVSPYPLAFNWRFAISPDHFDEAETEVIAGCKIGPPKGRGKAGKSLQLDRITGQLDLEKDCGFSAPVELACWRYALRIFPSRKAIIALLY